ncbi:MAG: ABC transporter substrate-binding protein, partial [Chloroflexota bacterium]|nr:ABC transporter substrate-binding protein [Chloroflexota bacterium]
MPTRQTRRSTLAAGVTTGTGALLVACGAPATTAPDGGTPRPSGATTAGTPAAQGSTAGGTLNYAEAGDFNDFNPWAYTAVNFELYNQVFSRLAWKDGDGKANPDLAESWTLAPDSTSLRLKLRSDVKWHDGKPFTAQDYVE